MKNNLKAGLILSICLFSVTGCAPKYTPLTPDQTNAIKRIGLVVSSASPQMEVIDHTQIMDKGNHPAAYQFGIVGALLVGIPLAIATSNEIDESLGGDPDLLRESLAGFELTGFLEQKIRDRLSKNHEVFLLKRIDDEEDLQKLAKEKNLDALLEVGFVFGLAAYMNEKASPVVVVDIKLTNVFAEETILKKRISSDSHFRYNNVIEEFAKNEAELFKNSIHVAADGVSTIVASEFGIDRDRVPAVQFAETMNSNAASCGNPYEITRDCNFFSGPEREIEINGVGAKIGASANGMVILVASDSIVLNSITDGLTLGISDTRTEPAKKAFEIIKSTLRKEGIQIIRITKLVSMGAIEGYFLELSADGYSILKKFSI